MKNEYLYWNCEKLIKAYKTKKLSPVEVVKETLNNAQTYHKSFNFITEHFEDKALENAKVSEELFLGKGNNKPRLLEGIPLAVKDEFALSGTYRTSGSKLYENRKDNFTDVYVERLLSGGVIPVIKTTTPEF